MNEESVATILLATAWIIYGAGHSLLASLSVKQWLFQRWPALQPAYRLIYNAVAVIMLLPQLALMQLYQGDIIFSWPAHWQWLAHGLALLALAGFIWSLKFYDMQAFLGLKQWRARYNPAQEAEAPFVISPLHRFVRHPWYSFALIILWTREMDIMMLTTSIIVTAYFFIGAYFEERKLVKFYGKPYQKYRQKVPGIIPLPWRYLAKERGRR